MGARQTLRSVEHVARISYGKDSLKMLDVLLSRGYPLDRVETMDVWAADGVSADLPDVVEFKKDMDKWIERRHGLKVEHRQAFRKDGTPATYENVFFSVPVRRNKNGRLRDGSILGFPSRMGPWCQRALKRTRRSVWWQVVYVGIAADEPARFGQLSNLVRAPLVENGIEEDLCSLYCQHEGILSPVYDRGTRDGCWFCHNQQVGQLRALRREWPDLWARLLEWDRWSSTPFQRKEIAVADYELRFSMEDEGLIDPKRRFFWGNILAPGWKDRWTNGVLPQKVAKEDLP